MQNYVQVQCRYDETMICQLPLFTAHPNLTLTIDDSEVNLKEESIMERHWYLQAGEDISQFKTIQITFDTMTVVKGFFTAWSVVAVEYSFNREGDLTALGNVICVF